METYRDILEHHGIKGQKWGVRRYRNYDGTLTSAGKKLARNVRRGAAVGAGLGTIGAARWAKAYEQLALEATNGQFHASNKYIAKEGAFHIGKNAVKFALATAGATLLKDVITTQENHSKSTLEPRTLGDIERYRKETEKKHKEPRTWDDIERRRKENRAGRI